MGFDGGAKEDRTPDLFAARDGELKQNQAKTKNPLERPLYIFQQLITTALGVLQTCLRNSLLSLSAFPINAGGLSHV